MMDTFWSIIDVLRKGSAVADPALLKNRGGLTMALTALLWALCGALKGFGYDLPITHEDAATVAAGVALVVGLFVNYASSDKVGIFLPKPLPDQLQAPDQSDVHRSDVVANRVDEHERLYPRDTGG